MSMYHFVLPFAWIALGGCWPLSEAEHKLDLITAQASQAVGLSTTNSSAITIQTVTLAKEINTTLAGLIVLLTIGTYWLLMIYTPTFSNEIVLPSKLLEQNISAVLSLTWPKHFLGPPDERIDYYPYPWVLFYKKANFEVKPHPKERPFHQILGFGEFGEQGQIDIKRERYMVPVKAFSPAMKSLVQIAIWNYISLWLVLVMIVNTLVYNGFLTHGITNDSIIRLVLVGVYAIASIGHRYHTTILLNRNFTSVLFQTCWTIISKKFIFGDYREYKHYAMNQHHNKPLGYRDQLKPDSSQMFWTSFDFELFGTTEHAETYQNLTDGDDQIGSCDESNVFSEWSLNDKRRGSHLKAREKIESKFDNFVKPIREAEINAYEKATDSTLDRALANVAVLLTICLATAFAPWNSAQTTSATSAQLGSYALLLSISAGILALISSMTQLTNATESARILLLLQEKTITAHRVHNETEAVSNEFWLRDEPDFSFSKFIKGKSQLTSSSLWRSMSLLKKLLCLLLGPALMLIPRMFGDRLSNPDHGLDFLSVKVQDVQLACWTVGRNLGRISSLEKRTRRERQKMR